MSRPASKATKAAKKPLPPPRQPRQPGGPQARGAARPASLAAIAPDHLTTRAVSSRRPRGGPSALEREADRTADAVLAGAVDLARGLGSASPARRLVPGSAGRPLPAGVRERLEAALGADLARVRIHTDAAAYAFVDDEHAAAITAGPDIFFAPGEYEPGSDEGFHLLAHEVVHTLQQTGRLSTDGLRRVTDARGPGEIQAADHFLDRLTGMSPSATFMLISLDHGATSTTSPIAAYHKTLATRLNHQVVPADQAFRDLVDDVLAGIDVPTSAAELSFLLDVLKAGQAWDAAATVIETSLVPLGTVKLSSTFVDWLLKGGRQRGWFSGALDLADAKALRDYRDLSLGAFRLFLVRPDLKPYTLDAKPFEEIFTPPAWHTTPLVVDERVLLAAKALLEIETERYKMCQRADSWTGSNSVATDAGEREFFGHAIFRGRRRALTLTAELDVWQRKALDPLSISAGKWFAERRARAEEFWTTAMKRWTSEAEQRQQLVRGNVVPADVRAKMRQALDANPVAAKAAAAVARAGSEFLDSAHADVPAAAEYASRVAALGKVLEAQTKLLLKDLGTFRLVAAGRASADLVPWLVLRLELLRQAGKRYDPAKDTTTFADTRHGHRLRMSGELQTLAIEMGNAVLENDCLRVQHHEAADTSLLVLVSDWKEPDSDSDLSQLVKDFREGIAFSPHIRFSAEAVAAFYKEDYLHRLGDEIQRRLEPTFAASAPDQLVLRDSVRKVTETKQARRWTVKDFDWAPNEREKRSVRDLIQTHEKSKKQLPPISDDLTIAYPYESARADLENVPHLPEVFVWTLPAWDRLAREAALALVELPELKHLGPVGTDGMAWLKLAAKHLSDTGLQLDSQITKRIDARLDHRWQEQRKRLGVEKLPPGLLRQATNADRQVVRRVAGGKLRKYDGLVGSWSLPVEALGLLNDFHRYALPSTDNVAQTVALVVEIADAMKKAFLRDAILGGTIEEKRYDLITGYYGFVMLAKRWLEDPAQRTELTTNFTRLTGSEIDARKQDLDAVLQAFERVRDRIQSSRGFESSGGKGLRSLNYPFIVTTDHVFGGGDHPRYQLMRVLFEPGFRFLPKYGEMAPKLADQEMGAHKEARVLNRKTGDPVPAETELFEIRVNDRVTVVRAKDVDALDDIWRAVEEKAFALSMENLQAAMEATATLALDLAEFIPGAGQALAVGRIVVSIGTFLMSNDFDEIKEIVSGDLQKQIEDLVQHLKDMLNPDELWMLLLFDLDLGFIGKLAQRAQAKDSGRARRARKKKGKLGRLLAALLDLGALIAREVELMHERIQPPLRSAQSFVVSHPIVATVVGLAADALEYGVESATPEVVKEFAADPAAAFAKRIEELVSAIDGFELPKDIIPEGMLIEAIIGLILDRFGAKGKAIRKALDVTGAMAEIGRMVAERLPEAAKPNHYWNEFLRPEVDKVLDTLRKDLVEGIYGALDTVGIKGVARPADRKPTVALTEGPVHEEEDEAEPALQPGWSPLTASGIPSYAGDVIPPGPGSPLPDRTRSAVEAGFGRSFAHVRLHRQPLGDGVDALTRGSHVVMRPGLSLDQGRGGHVLRHELTHVAQQTGPQTSGVPRPTRGRPGSTVRFDAGAEGAAERAATTGRLGGTQHAGSDHGAGAAAPALSDKVLGKVLNRLADYQDLRAFQEEVQGSVSSAPPLDAQQKTDVEKFREKLKAALESDSLRVSGVPMKVGKLDPKDIVRKHAKNAALRTAAMDRPHPEALSHIFRQALREDRAAAKKKSSKAKARKFNVIPSQLSTLLEGYLLVRTGLITTIDLPRTSAAFSTELHGSTPIDLKVTGIFLGGAIKSSPLWEPILESQLKPKAGKVLYGAARKGQSRLQFPLKSADDQERIFQAVVHRIRSRGPRFRALGPGYLLVDSLIEDAVDQSLSPQGTALSTKELPPADDYVRTTIGSSGKPEVGLRVDTHGRLGMLKVKDRESHHTTQYLFAEFFTNRLENVQPFASAREPGLSYTGTEPNTLFRADGGQAINLRGLAGTVSGRGESMPAIYVSKHTHQKASDLHVGRSSVTLPDGSKSSSSQSNTVNDWFEKKVKAAATAKELATPGSTAMAVASFKPEQVARNKQLVAGVLHVYAEMNKHLMRTLRDALHVEEVDYYATLASEDKSRLDSHGLLKAAWQLRPTDLNRVFATAKRKNDDVMKVHGVKP